MVIPPYVRLLLVACVVVAGCNAAVMPYDCACARLCPAGGVVKKPLYAAIDGWYNT
ncbi:hypothetical protein ACVDAB_003788 [Salmonella enterica subsp. enterica serovar Newport]